LVALGSLAAGCGIPTAAAPRPIAKSAIPFQLLSPTSPAGATTTTTPPASFTVPVSIYLVGPTQQNLVSTQRLVAPPAPLDTVLDALLAGPTVAESALGISTAFPSSVRVLSATVANGVATVNFNAAFGNISGQSAVLAVAQVVFTVTSELTPETGVLFEIEGTPTTVPDASGAQVAGPVHVLQYLTLAPGSKTGSGSAGAGVPPAVTQPTG